MPRIKVHTIINTNTNNTNDINNTNNTNNTIEKTFKFGTKEVKLDKYQQKVIDAEINKNLRIIACAGSGKTTTILCRIKYMIDFHKVNPKRILVTTFNTDAAEILKSRLKLLFNKDSDVRIGTFDSIAAHFYFKYFKQDGFVGINEYSNLLKSYLDSENAKNILDLYDYIIFDEFQDINNIQFDIIKKFIDNGSKLIAIGDDAQNIYQWRGSNISFILNLDKIFPNTLTLKLEYNYRSTPEIINLATSIIKNNTDQIEKNMFPSQKSSHKPLIKKYHNNTLQATDIIIQIYNLYKNNINLSDIVVISRNNFGLKIFEEQLEVFNRDNSEKKRIDYLALISDNDKNASKNYSDKLCLATIHKIKGCEWEYVFLIDVDDKIFPSDCDDIGIQEERRLLYVAVTRAKTFLQISFTTNNISRFFGEINRELYTFPEYKNSYFEINNKRSFQTKTKVTELIQLFNNKDYEYMRNQNILPNVIPTDLEIHTKNTSNKTILDDNLQSDYGIYIDTYISRMFGILNEKSNGLNNTTAKCTIYSIELNNMMYAIYLESKLPLHLLEHGFNIEKVFHTIFDFDESKMKLLHSIIKKILNKAKSLNVLPMEIYVTKYGFLPNEFELLMTESYNKYITNKEIPHKDIYNISLCHNVFLNRKRLLYRDCFDMFDLNKKIYDDIKIFCEKYYKNYIEIKLTVLDKDRLISGELDMYDYSNKKIIDFKTSNSNQIQIEWILQLLTYAALIRIHKKLPVECISIYNPISGIESIIDIKNWNKEKELLDYIKQVRDEREKIKKASLNDSIKFERPKKIIKDKFPLEKEKDTIKPIKKKDYKEKRDIVLDNIEGFDDMDEETMKDYIKLTKK